jgi:hypothetical protein
VNFSINGEDRNNPLKSNIPSAKSLNPRLRTEPALENKDAAKQRRPAINKMQNKLSNNLSKSLKRQRVSKDLLGEDS